jgi:DNA-binding XRE family transcriptional regulator
MLYFIQQDQFIKIGYTRDIKSRLSSLQVSSPIKLKVLALMDGTISDEEKMHKMFKHLSVNGEWFQYCDELIKFIETIDKDLLWFHGFIDHPTNPIGLIKKCRLERNLAMSDLGKMLGVSKQAIRDMEQREITGSITVKALSKALETMNYKLGIRAKELKFD